MILTKGQMVEIKETYCAALRSAFGEVAEEMLSWIDTTDFYTAPASTQFHYCDEGNLVLHHLNVMKALVNVETVFGDVSEENKDERIKACKRVALTHDWCKINCYNKSFRSKKVYSPDGDKWDENGKFKWMSIQSWDYSSQFPFGHGEASVYLVNKFTRLSDEEALAIRWHMSGWDDTLKSNARAIGKATEFGTLISALQIADQIAANLVERD